MTEWNDERGFGFIDAHDEGPRLFAHVSEFPRGRRPVEGAAVTYAATLDDQNRLQATAVRYASARGSRRAPARGLTAAFAVALSFFPMMAALSALGDLPAWLIAAYAGASAVAIFLYATDKAAAQQGRWRTPESTLHLVAALGGWPGALIARHLFRHKTTKEPFRTIFWVTVIINCAALASYLVVT